MQFASALFIPHCPISMANVRFPPSPPPEAASVLDASQSLTSSMYFSIVGSSKYYSQRRPRNSCALHRLRSTLLPKISVCRPGKDPGESERPNCANFENQSRSRFRFAGIPSPFSESIFLSVSTWRASARKIVKTRVGTRFARRVRESRTFD